MTAVELREKVTRTSRAARHGIRAFYARPIGWLALGVTSAVLAYGGGGVMFWFHAIYRGEAGPPINDWYHWLFDSSLGFVALTPVLFLILPGALFALRRAGIVGARLKAAAYVVLVGVLFGVATGPGPILHDRLVGGGTALADLAVRIFGPDPEVAIRNLHAHPHSALTEGSLQVAVGVPVYIVAGLVALSIVRAVSRARSRA